MVRFIEDLSKSAWEESFEAALLGAAFDAVCEFVFATAFLAFAFLGAGLDFLAVTFLALAVTDFLAFATVLAFLAFFAGLAGDFFFLAIFSFLHLVKDLQNYRMGAKTKNIMQYSRHS